MKWDLHEAAKNCLRLYKILQRTIQIENLRQIIRNSTVANWPPLDGGKIIQVFITMKCLIFALLQLLVVQSADSFHWFDCTYEKDAAHVEYICEGGEGTRFSRRNGEFLFCNNVDFGIDRKTVRKLSFHECRGAKQPLLSPFVNLRWLNLSSSRLEYLSPDKMATHKLLDTFIAAKNEISRLPANLFIHTSEITEVDFSCNQIRDIDPFFFDNVRKLRTIRFGGNKVAELHERLFSNLPELETIDFSDNHIQIIENSLFKHNKKLKSANFWNNQIKRLNCAFVLTLMDVPSLNLSLNSLNDLRAVCGNTNGMIKFNVTIASNGSAETALSTANGQFQWVFSKSDFLKLRYLNISHSDMENIPALLEEASSQLITLDLSNTSVGALNDTTFRKFTQLQFFYLSRTNLSNFQFATFYHQLNLVALDISYNNLKTIDFHLFLRNFRNLESLNLEGNNLTEIDTIQRTHFPRLSALAISKNPFSCEYLLTFLLQWPDLILVHNPSDQVHMGGVDCIHQNQMKQKTKLSRNKLTAINENGDTTLNSSAYANHLNELYTIKVILVAAAGIILMICLFFIFAKCVRFICNCPKRTKFATNSVLFKNQENNNKYNKNENIYVNEL